MYNYSNYQDTDSIFDDSKRWDSYILKNYTKNNDNKSKFNFKDSNKPCTINTPSKTTFKQSLKNIFDLYKPITKKIDCVNLYGDIKVYELTSKHYEKLLFHRNKTYKKMFIPPYNNYVPTTPLDYVPYSFDGKFVLINRDIGNITSKFYSTYVLFERWCYLMSLSHFYFYKIPFRKREKFILNNNYFHIKSEVIFDAIIIRYITTTFYPNIFILYDLTLHLKKLSFQLEDNKNNKNIEDNKNNKNIEDNKNNRNIMKHNSQSQRLFITILIELFNYSEYYNTDCTNNTDCTIHNKKLKRLDILFDYILWLYDTGRISNLEKRISIESITYNKIIIKSYKFTFNLPNELLYMILIHDENLKHPPKVYISNYDTTYFSILTFPILSSLNVDLRRNLMNIKNKIIGNFTIKNKSMFGYTYEHILCGIPAKVTHRNIEYGPAILRNKYSGYYYTNGKISRIPQYYMNELPKHIDYYSIIYEYQHEDGNIEYCVYGPASVNVFHFNFCSSKKRIQLYYSYNDKLHRYSKLFEHIPNKNGKVIKMYKRSYLTNSNNSFDSKSLKFIKERNMNDLNDACLLLRYDNSTNSIIGYYKYGRLHRDPNEGPALIDNYGHFEYLYKGIYHRDPNEGPAKCITILNKNEPFSLYDEQYKSYDVNSKIYTTSGNLIILDEIWLNSYVFHFTYFEISYYYNGKLHRDRRIAPAKFTSYGVEFYEDGKLLDPKDCNSLGGYQVIKNKMLI